MVGSVQVHNQRESVALDMKAYSHLSAEERVRIDELRNRVDTPKGCSQNRCCRKATIGIPPLCETYPPFCEHPFGVSSYPARSYEQSQSMTLVIWMPSSVMPSLCQSRVSTVRGNASPNRRSGANSRSRVCSSVMFNVT